MKARRRRFTAVAAAAVALATAVCAKPCLAGGADGRPPDAPVSHAHQLFDEARTLMDRGEYEKAAVLLEAALKELPGKGISFQLGVCYEKLGRFASAWARYQEVAYLEDAAGDEARAQIARSHALAIAPMVPHLVVAVASPVDGLVVERDGVPMAGATWGTPLPQDPGRVVVSASAPGRRTWETTVQLDAGHEARVDVPALDVMPAVPPATPEHSATASIERPPAKPLSVRRIAALSTGGVGLAAVATGALFAVQSISAYQSAGAYCDASNRCSDPRGVTLRQQAISDGNVATVAFSVAAAALAAGVLLWVTGSSRAPSPRAMAVEMRW